MLHGDAYPITHAHADTSRPLSKNISKPHGTKRSGRVVFGDVIYGAGGRHGPRVQLDFQLVAVLTGEARVAAAGTEVVVPARHAALLPPGRSEEFAFSPRRRDASRVVFRASLARRARPAGSLPAGAVDPAVGAPVGNAHRTGAHPCPPTPAPSSDRLIEALGLAATRGLRVYGSRRPGGAGGPMRSAGAGVGAAARRSTGGFCRAWRGRRGLAFTARQAFPRAPRTTPMRHVWKARHRARRAAFAGDGLSVAEAAYRCGFQTPFHFARCVRTHFGDSPSRVRVRSRRMSETTAFIR